MSRTEADIVRDIVGCYADLSPENLSWDGERSAGDIARAGGVLRHRLRQLKAELGRDLGEAEAYGMGEALPRLTAEEALEKALARRTAKYDTSATTATRLGLPADVIGRSYLSRRTRFTITGFKTVNRKFPVMATNQNGKRFKLSVEQVLIGLGEKTATPKVFNTDTATARRLGLPEDIVGRSFTSRGTVYTVDGFKPNNHKFPVLATNHRGTRYKWQVSDVLGGLPGAGVTAVNSPVTPIARPNTSSSTATRLGLPSDTVDRIVKLGRSSYRVIGFKSANRKYPVLTLRQPDGKEFKLSVAQVQLGLQAAA